MTLENIIKVAKGEEKADLVLTVSKSLRDTFSGNKNVHWIANGVDVDYFKEAVNKKSDKEKIQFKPHK